MAIIIKCEVCEGEFKRIPSHIGKFCSIKCANISYTKKITKSCPVCETLFETKPSKNSTFCSLKCRGTTQRIKKITKNCKQCKKSFESSPRLNAICCSLKCRGIERSIELDKIRLIIHCEVCKTSFKTPPNKIRKFCSQKCYHISKTDEFINTQKLRQLTEATIDSVDFANLPPSETEFTNWQIEDIFKLDIINTMDIGDDVTTFSLKNG